MSGVSYRIDVDDAAARAALEAALGRADDLSPAMDEIGRTIVDHAVLRFEREVDPDGNPWAALAPSTVRRKTSRGRPAAILVESGRLRSSLTHSFERDAVTVGTNVVYAAIHQFGGDVHHEARTATLHLDSRGGFVSKRDARKRKSGVRTISAEIGAHLVHIPARPFIGLDQADREDIPEILARHVLGGAA